MDTNHNIQPYEFHILPGQRVLIVNPLTGLRIKKSKGQIQNELGQGIGFRPLSTHEKVMLQNALKQFGDES